MSSPTQATTAPPQRILDNLNTAVLLFDRDLKLEYINPAGEMLFEVSAKRLRRRRVGDLFPAAENMAEALAEALASGHPFTRREMSLRLSPEREITVDFTVLPISDGRRRRELLVELVQIDRQLRISREEQLLAQQSVTRELLRGLAHEVKNPLGGLRGAAQLLERELDEEGLKEYTQVIIGEADRLQKLVDRILGPNKLPQKSALNVHELLEYVRQLLLAEDTGVQIRRDYDPSIPELIADRDLLVQAVLNIARNASQATGAGGTLIFRTRVLRQFTIGHTRHRLVLRLEIIDDGPGIAPEMMERIFYPMVTGRPDGTGLGLSIAQSLVQQHGGIVQCESRPGRTVFAILLPVTEQDANGKHA